jgi:hypothetical protein
MYFIVKKYPSEKILLPFSSFLKSFSGFENVFYRVPVAFFFKAKSLPTALQKPPKLNVWRTGIYLSLNTYLNNLDLLLIISPALFDFPK